MTRTSARAKKSKQDVNKKKEDAKQLDETQTDSEGAGESTDKENDSTNYDVEKITHTRIFKGKRQFLVRWKGYTEDSDTWETESALQSCKEILEAFKKEHLTEANSDDESEEEAEIKGRAKTKKVTKNVKKNSGKSSKQEIENEDSEFETEKELEEKKTKEVKEKIKKKEPKGKKRKSAKGTESSKAKKSKTDESDDQSVENEDSIVETEEEPEVEGTKETKAKIKGKSLSETEESDVDSKEIRKKKEPVGKKVKPVKKTEAKKSKKDESDDESVTDGKDYEVEKILEVHTRKDGSHEFLIRWKGYRPSDDTWEPEAHLDCQELIEKFMEKVDRAKDFTKKELRQRTEKKRFVPLSTRRFTHQRNSGLRPCYQESYED